MKYTTRDGPAVAAWLLCVTVLICAMILLGGATRLTGSGLSITQWRPITGLLPPLSSSDWHEAFALYRQIPQYQLLNPDMTLEGFRRIFWWEWSHRAFGRLIGVVFVLPYLWFALRKRLSSRLLGRLFLILALGALQGAIGWYMVASGLEDRVYVDPYRLALHLGMAFLLLGLCLWNGLALLRPLREQSSGGWPRRMAGAIVAAVLLQIVLGALVAGERGDIVDPELAPGIAISSAKSGAVWLGLHQSLAYGLVLAILLYASLSRTAAGSRLCLAAAILLQAGLGIFALLSGSGSALVSGLLHQAGAVLVFILAVVHFQETRRDTP